MKKENNELRQQLRDVSAIASTFRTDKVKLEGELNSFK